MASLIRVAERRHMRAGRAEVEPSEFDGLIWPRGDGPSWPHLAGDVSGC